MSVNNGKDLLCHVGHEIEVVYYGKEHSPVSVAIECETCGVVLLDFNLDTEVTCPRCGMTYNEDPECRVEHTSIGDHGMCTECHRKWQLGELDDE